MQAVSASRSCMAVAGYSFATDQLSPSPPGSSGQLVRRPFQTLPTANSRFSPPGLRIASRRPPLTAGARQASGLTATAAAATSSPVVSTSSRNRGTGSSCSLRRGGLGGWQLCERVTSTTMASTRSRMTMTARMMMAMEGGCARFRSSGSGSGSRGSTFGRAAEEEGEAGHSSIGDPFLTGEAVSDGARSRASVFPAGRRSSSRSPLLPPISCSVSDGQDTTAASSLSTSSSSSAATGGGDSSSAKSATGRDGGSAIYLAVAVACLGAFLFGYHLGVVNGSLEYIAKDLGILQDTVSQGWIVSSTLAGAAIGALSGGSLADWLGRTKAFQVDVLPLVVGTLLSANANVVQSMILGRFLVGIGIGLTSAVVPLYISEVAPTDIRGKLGTVNQLCICIGILAALIAGLPLAGNPVWWRTMFSMAAVPAVLLAIGMQFCPESPRWLYQTGKMKETENAVTKLWGASRADAAMAELRESAASSAGEEESRWSELFGKRYWKVMIIGIAMFFFQQFAGINAVVYYSSAVFRKVGIASDVAASALVGATNVFGTCIASFLMDKQGRKKLLIGSYLGMALSMLLLAVSLSWKALARFSGPLAVVGTMAYVLAFSLGVGPVPALLLPEIFANRIRAKAVALSLVTHWVCNFVIGLTFLGVVNAIGVSSVYLGFAGVCLLAILFVDRFVVETKGRSLEEIERMLAVSTA